MYDIYGMSNTVSGMLPFTVLCMCSVVCTQCTHLVSFGYVYVMMLLCNMLYVLVHECMVYLCLCVASDSHSGLEDDQTFRKVCICNY